MTRLGCYVSVLAAAAVLSSGVRALAQQQGPTLGEVAKKEEARRKGIPTPSKVYTNKDLPKTPAPPAPPPGTLPPAVKPAAEQKPEEAAKPDEEVKDETWWRARMTVVRTELQRQEMAVDAFQSRVNALSTDFAARDDPYQRAQLAIDRQKTLNELERVKGEIARLKQQISDIEEEARLAGVPPGWLR